MEKLYKADNFCGNQITEVEVVRETEHSVWYISKTGREEMDRKKTHSHRYYDNLPDAINFCLDYLETDLKGAERIFKERERRLREFRKKYLDID